MFYELGLAHALGKQVILTTQDRADVPFDIQHRRYIRYDLNAMDAFRTELTETIRSVLDEMKDEGLEAFKARVQSARNGEQMSAAYAQLTDAMLGLGKARKIAQTPPVVPSAKVTLEDIKKKMRRRGAIAARVQNAVAQQPQTSPHKPLFRIRRELEL